MHRLVKDSPTWCYYPCTFLLWYRCCNFHQNTPFEPLWELLALLCPTQTPSISYSRCGVGGRSWDLWRNQGVLCQYDREILLVSSWGGAPSWSLGCRWWGLLVHTTPHVTPLLSVPILLPPSPPNHFLSLFPKSSTRRIDSICNSRKSSTFRDLLGRAIRRSLGCLECGRGCGWGWVWCRGRSLLLLSTHPYPTLSSPSTSPPTTPSTTNPLFHSSSFSSNFSHLYPHPTPPNYKLSTAITP